MNKKNIHDDHIYERTITEIIFEWYFLSMYLKSHFHMWTGMYSRTSLDYIGPALTEDPSLHNLLWKTKKKKKRLVFQILFDVFFQFRKSFFTDMESMLLRQEKHDRN